MDIGSPRFAYCSPGSLISQSVSNERWTKCGDALLSRVETWLKLGTCQIKVVSSYLTRVNLVLAIPNIITVSVKVGTFRNICGEKTTTVCSSLIPLRVRKALWSNGLLFLSLKTNFSLVNELFYGPFYSHHNNIPYDMSKQRTGASLLTWLHPKRCSAWGKKAGQMDRIRNDIWKGLHFWFDRLNKKPHSLSINPDNLWFLSTFLSRWPQSYSQGVPPEKEGKKSWDCNTNVATLITGYTKTHTEQMRVRFPELSRESWAIYCFHAPIIVERFQHASSTRDKSDFWLERCEFNRHRPLTSETYLLTYLPVSIPPKSFWSDAISRSFT